MSCLVFLYLFIVNDAFFRRLGLPGAWCSIDGTHVPLGKCPEDAKVMYKSGRYPKPTMAFIVLASHNYQMYELIFTATLLNDYNDMIPIND